MVSKRPVFRYGANLSGANLSGLDLTNEENLHVINLSNSNLSHANLSGLRFYKPNLAGADLSNSILRDTHFDGADLSNSNLSHATLSGAWLYDANLSGADLSNSNLSHAKLSGARLNNANLSGADLSNSNFSRANLSGANLHGANLDGADLSNSNLSRAIMQDGLVHVKIIDEVNKDLENKFYHVSNLLSESEWVVLKEKEDAYRRTGALPMGYVKVSNNRLNLTFHLSRKRGSGPSTSHLISRIFYFAKENSNAVNFYAKAYSKNFLGSTFKYSLNGGMPFVYLCDGNELHLYEETNNSQSSIVTKFMTPAEMNQVVRKFANDPRTAINEPSSTFIRPRSCKCRSGWVTNRNGGVFNASDAGPCADCKEFGYYKFEPAHRW